MPVRVGWRARPEDGSAGPAGARFAPAARIHVAPEPTVSEARPTPPTRNPAGARFRTAARHAARRAARGTPPGWPYTTVRLVPAEPEVPVARPADDDAFPAAERVPGNGRGCRGFSTPEFRAAFG